MAGSDEGGGSASISVQLDSATRRELERQAARVQCEPWQLAAALIALMLREHKLIAPHGVPIPARRRA